MKPGKGLGVFLILILYNGLKSQEVTYFKDIKPIIEQHCIKCHTKGAIGPMPLDEYDKVASYGKMIEYVVTEKIMPPWLADAHYNHYKEENVLSVQNIELIKSWVNSGLKQGHEKTSFGNKPNVSSSMIEFDLEVGMAESFEQYGVYYDQYQVFVIPVNNEKDLFITDLEFIPKNKEIVKSCTISVDTSEASEALDNWDPRYGYNQFGSVGFIPQEYVFHHWSAGDNLLKSYSGMSKKLPKGSKLIFHINYGPTGVPQTDSSVLRIRKTEFPERILTSIPIITEEDILNPPFIIPKGEKRIFHATKSINKRMVVYSIMPQSQLICSSWEIYAKHPSGEIIKLLKIPEWNFHWKRAYFLETPILLPQGSELHAIATYDNTSENLSNPSSPPTTIKSGFGMFEEQFLVHMEVVYE